MRYQLLQIADSTSLLQKGESYLDVQDTFRFLVWGNYSWADNFPVESVSPWAQVTAADRQLKRTFNKLARKWKRETINVSSMQQMVLHPAYGEIIGLGGDAIPLILKELEKEPDFWFWALMSLTREDPVTEEIRGDLKAMREVWLDWGIGHGYL